MPETDLSTVSAEELANEITRRYDAAIIIGWSALDSTRNYLLSRYHGPKHVLIGLAHAAREEFSNKPTEPAAGET